MPPHGFYEAVDVLEELPGEAALADARRTDDRDQARTLLAAGRVEQVLQEAQLRVPADERGFERLAPVASPAFCDDPERAPSGNGARFSLEHLLAGFLECDCPRRRALGGLANEHGPGRRNRLEAACRVDEVAGHHALVRGPDGDGRLASQDSGPRLDGRAKRMDRIHKVEGGTNGSLCIVLLSDGCAPNCHDGVADEFLDRAAIPPDDVPGKVEVAG